MVVIDRMNLDTSSDYRLDIVQVETGLTDQPWSLTHVVDHSIDNLVYVAF
jgi:hypothetical protein